MIIHLKILKMKINKIKKIKMMNQLKKFILIAKGKMKITFV